jgi:hypothetical protein
MTPYSEAKCPRLHDLSCGTYCASVSSLLFQIMDMTTHHLPLSSMTDHGAMGL